MARACTICEHPARDSIDAALVSGEPMKVIAERFGVGKDAIRRHRLRHLSPALAAMQAEREHDGATSLLARVEALIGRTERLLECAEQDGKVSAALAAVRELRGLLELLGKASGELDTRPVTVVNLQTAPEWLAVRAVILSALAGYPQARAVVSGRLLELEAGE